MKLLTLNAHSLQGEDASRHLEDFIQGILRIRPDLIALQEANQPRAAAPMDYQGRQGYVQVPSGIPLRRDNYAGTVARRLLAAGVSCFWCWLPVKLGYEKYDEGLALLSLRAPIAQTHTLLLSAKDDYQDWRTRKALGVHLENSGDWFYSVHLGWWEDTDPFAAQWARLEAGIKEKRGRVWLLGDFNSPAHVRDQGFDLVKSSGWQDTYQLAEARDGGETVRGVIDGWRERPAGDGWEGMRIDYIWCSQTPKVSRSWVVFDGEKYPVVSDHLGILVETEE